MAGDGKTPGTGEQVVASQGERVENVCESVNATTFQRGGEGRERERCGIALHRGIIVVITDQGLSGRCKE